MSEVMDGYLSERAERIRMLGRRVIADVIEIGRLLSECKARLAHGHWLPWLEREFGWTDKTAERFIAVYQLCIGKFDKLSNLDLPVSSLYLLAAPSTPEAARSEVIARAEAGERLACSGVSEIISRHSRSDIMAAASQVRADIRDELRAQADAVRDPAAVVVDDLTSLAARGGYGAILVDPPWPFATWSHVGLAGDRWQERRAERSREPPYRTMTVEDIGALPVAGVAAPDCALFLWVVQTQLPAALAVIERWGFVFKSVAFGWIKGVDEGIDTVVPIGTGYWTRAGLEQCWLATRGHPRRLAADVRQVIIEPRREHSRKPDCVHERIERLVAGPYLELFARRERPGWTTWGDECRRGLADEKDRPGRATGPGCGGSAALAAQAAPGIGGPLPAEAAVRSWRG
jgi:N6-adenosine-specific RNA methylase IME4